ncbi:MAG TPA: hypothetical protein VLB47_06570, partial [Solirubrobacteraceae bacterium]|nr:hypothetical protein [Solirubrobacteraceae bacterium]
LDHQLRTREALVADELRYAMSYDAGSAAGPVPDAAWWKELGGRLTGGGHDPHHASSLPRFGGDAMPTEPQRHS